MTPLGFEHSGGDYGGPVSATPVEQPGAEAEEVREFIARNRQVGKTFVTSYISLSLDTLDALLARLEAAEGEGARLRGTLEAMLDPLWWREDVDVNGEYTTSRALGYYELVPRIQEVLAQSEGLPS